MGAANFVVTEEDIVNIDKGVELGQVDIVPKTEDSIAVIDSSVELA